MRKQVQITLKPQFVTTTNTKFRGNHLHSFQETMLHLDQLEEEVLILTAPTGTGKSYSFPLPIIQYKELKQLAPKRALIISPTNALIEDMCREYADLASREKLKITELNSKILDRIDGARGTKRWTEILKLISKNDIAITNPDILNWAMTGGYSFQNWQEQVTELIKMVHYFIFDEYHIYDEEQIGNIIGWMLFIKMIFKERFKTKKFIFASATPEPALANLLRQHGFSVCVKDEDILDKPFSKQDRKIKGEVKLSFLKLDSKTGEARPDDGVVNFLLKEQDFKPQLPEKRTLVIFDELESLRRTKKKIELKFKPFKVAETSGYTTKEKEPDRIDNADLIIATNKVEVGVNLGVQTVLMPTGKYLRNFIQRLGRVARKGTDGDAYVFVDRFKTYTKYLEEGQSISYYELLDYLQNKGLLTDKEFYENVIPRFIGAFFFVMLYQTLKVHSFKEILRERLKINPLTGEAKYMFNVLQAIHLDINQLKKIDKSSGYYKQRKAIEEWWGDFRKTFCYFRGDSRSIKIIDLDENDKETEYSLEWNLKHREILNKRETEEGIIYEVGGFRDEKAELQYIVDTFPFGSLNEGNRVLSQKDKWNLPRVFEERVKIAEKRWQPTNEFAIKVIQILENVKHLRLIFTQKRLKIDDIKIAPGAFL